MAHPIRYVVLMGDRPARTGSVVVANDLVDNKLFSIGLLPHCFEHLVAGCDFFQSLMLGRGRFGLLVSFVYADSLKIFPTDDPEWQQVGCSVFVVVTHNNQCLDRIASFLSAHMGINDTVWVDDRQLPWFTRLNVCRSTDDVIQHLVEVAPAFVNADDFPAPYCVPVMGRDIDRGFLFNPTCVNTQTAQAMLGNWAFPLNHYSQQDIADEQQKASTEADSFNRQSIFIDQIKRMNAVENQCLLPLASHPFTDQLKAPLVMALPFTNSDTRRFFKAAHKAVAGYEKQQRHINYVLSRSTDRNYTYTILASDIEKQELDPAALGAAFYFIYHNRSHFLDIASMLHCSLRFSPYIRLPFLGVEINKELSFVAPKLSGQLLEARDRRSVEQVMTQLGEKIADSALGSDTRELLVRNKRQIVAVSDLPVEWITVDGVPLGFSHDVCRIPEFPMEGILMHYNAATYFEVSIPEDMMSRTLVVYGTDEPSFKPYQQLCDDLSREVGFNTAYCLSANDFYRAVAEFKPLLLVIDTHGGYDAEHHQTYMLMGDDKVYPQALVDNNVSAPLVFLSACNTAPAYNSVNTLANGFMEAGAVSVTSSYMPLDIDESSTLYLRLLRQLSEACRGTQHTNWLAFVSHILRTSYIHAAFYNYYRESPKSIEEIAFQGLNTQMLCDVMFFAKRREVYGKLKSGITVDGIEVNLENKVPHYLMYSTIGRADLVVFDTSGAAIRQANESSLSQKSE